MSYTINNEVIPRIKSDPVLIGKLAKAIDRSYQTVDKLLSANQPNSALTLYASVEIITGELQLSFNDVLQN